ncbi:nuclear transport factor 2 family protein [Rouxiella sp. Mn2063]|uniref:nuclear transport factor 2 family protein n=1 Tax=Rouxiella sp. Mn2063 TaxID=3395262 RepID=UPI003BED161C
MNQQQIRRLQQLEDQQAVRVCISDYMRLCDDLNSQQTAEAIGELFTADACWEGLGAPYAARLGVHQGRKAIVAMMQRYVRQPAHFAMNAHFLCSESIEQQQNGQWRGRWLMLQTSTFNAGGSHLNAAEIMVWFVRDGRAMRMMHFTTRNLFSRLVDYWRSADDLPVPNEKPPLTGKEINHVNDAS